MCYVELLCKRDAAYRIVYDRNYVMLEYSFSYLWILSIFVVCVLCHFKTDLDSYVCILYRYTVCGILGFVILDVNCSPRESTVWKSTAQISDNEK
jgi:hypothetical protein